MLGKNNPLKILRGASCLLALAILTAPAYALSDKDADQGSANGIKAASIDCGGCESKSGGVARPGTVPARDALAEQLYTARKAGDTATINRIEAQIRSTQTLAIPEGGDAQSVAVTRETRTFGGQGDPHGVKSDSNASQIEATFGPDVKVRSFNFDTKEINQSMATDSAGNMYVVWQDDNFVSLGGYEYLQLYKSTDGGATWTAFGFVQNLSAHLKEPSIAIGEGITGDLVLIAYIVDDGVAIPTPEVATSPLSAGSFTVHPVPMYTFWQGYAKPVIWTDSYEWSGWYAYLTFEGIVDAATNNINTVFSRSIDTGVTWDATPQVLYGDFDAETWIDPDGTYGTTLNRVFVANFNGTTNTLNTMYSNDFGVSFQPNVVIGTFTNTGTVYLPSIKPVDPDIEAATGANNVMIVFTKSTDNTNDDIGQTYSTDAGTTWPNPLWTLEGQTTSHEFAAELNANEGGGSWHLTYTSPGVVYYSQRAQDLSTFWQATPDVVSDALASPSSDFPKKAITSNWATDLAGIAWADFRDGFPDYDTYFSVAQGVPPEPIIDIIPTTINFSQGESASAPTEDVATANNISKLLKEPAHVVSLVASQKAVVKAQKADLTKVALAQGSDKAKLPDLNKVVGSKENKKPTSNKENINATAGIKVGEEVIETIESMHPYPGTSIVGAEVVWERTISRANASYISIHFSAFNLAADDYVEISSPDGQYSYTYKGKGKLVRGGKAVISTFWATHIPGDTAIVRLYSSGAGGKYGFAIDKWAHGFSREVVEQLLEPISETPTEIEAICGIDDKEWAMCQNGTTMYDKARAVARLLINGTSACTGWLVGSQNHLMTNNHCINTQTTADNTDYEFMAEGATCLTNCASWFACPGTVEASSGVMIKTLSTLDYTLIALPVNVSSTYGYLQLRDTPALLDERIYIPQHPQAWGKQIAVSDDQSSTGLCNIDSLNEPGCTGGPGDLGYYADTAGGSSGSPVIAFNDHCVVALHHCAGGGTPPCPTTQDMNRGVDITDVITDLGADLPLDAICGASSGGKNFIIFNNGTAVLNITAMTKRDGDAWLDYSPKAPFTIPAGSSRTVTVTVDYALMTTGLNDERIIVESNDVDMSPFPVGVLINAITDVDGDGVLDNVDNCTLVANPAQRDTDGDDYGNYCDPDFDNNLIVNVSDLFYLKSKFLTADPNADLNGDGIVNVSDLFILKGMYLQPPGPSGLVP